MSPDCSVTCFETCGTGSLFLRVDKGYKVPLMPRLCRQQAYRTGSGTRCIKVGTKVYDNKLGHSLKMLLNGKM